MLCLVQADWYFFCFFLGSVGEGAPPGLWLTVKDNSMATKVYESTDKMSAACKSGLRSLLLACADTKLLMGYHYGEWTFGPPEIEAAVACCSLCQGELGHVRLLHALLHTHFGDDPDTLVEKREPTDFANITFLDNEIRDWSGLVAVNYLVDLAVTSVLHAMKDSSFKPLHMSLGKMLDEERYHIHHGQGWFRTLARKSDATRKAIEASATEALATVVAWFGPAGNEEDAALTEAGIKTEYNASILQGYLNAVGGLADELGIGIGLSKNADGTFTAAEQMDWRHWNLGTRRVLPGGPDAEILYHLQGSKNEIFKL